MFNQLRLRLILITMVSISLVVGLITGAINFFNLIRLQQKADSILRVIADFNGDMPHDKYTLEEHVDFNVNDETPFQIRYFVVYTDNRSVVTNARTDSIASVDYDDLQRFADVTRGLPEDTYGTYENFRYLVSKTPYGRSITVVDRSSDIEFARQMISISVIIGLTGLLLIFIILIFASNIIVRPFIKNQELQKQFITDAGHELKTPLAIISTNAEVLECCYGQNEWLDSIKNQTSRLDGLVKGLLQLTRNNGVEKSEHIQFPLSAAVSEIASSFTTLAEHHGHKLNLNIVPNITLKGDAQAIRTLVSVLVDNAIKYSSENGDINVSLTKMGIGTSKTAKLVVDNKTDIDDSEDINRYFERFYRSDSSRSTQGYGIGLSVAKSVIEAHKGKITVSKNKDRIYFTVVL